MLQLQSSQRVVVVVEAIARVRCGAVQFGVRNKASSAEDVVSCVVEDGRKPWDPKLGNLAHDTSGWLVTKGLQLTHCRGT